MNISSNTNFNFLKLKILGCSAGFLNVPRIKGSHYAMKSGMLAAESILEEIWSEQSQETAGIEPKSYEDKYENNFFDVLFEQIIINILFQNKKFVHLERFIQSSECTPIIPYRSRLIWWISGIWLYNIHGWPRTMDIITWRTRL